MTTETSTTDTITDVNTDDVTQTTDDNTQTTDDSTTTDEGITPEKAKDALYGEDDKKEDDDAGNPEDKPDDAGEDESKTQNDDESGEDDKPYKLEFDNETINVSDAIRGKLEEFGSERGLKQEDLQDGVKIVAEAQQEEFNTTLNTWSEESLADKEIGGEAYEANIKIAAKPLQKFGSEKLIEILEQTGLNRNAEMIRVFYRIGQAMSEGESVDATKAQAEPDILTKLYGPSTGSN